MRKKSTKRMIDDVYRRMDDIGAIIKNPNVSDEEKRKVLDQFNQIASDFTKQVKSCIAEKETLS